MRIDNYQIEKINKGDVDAVKAASSLIWDVFNECTAVGFTEDGVRMFKEFISPENLEKGIKKGTFSAFAAFFEKNMAGTLFMKDHHISLLFIGKDHQRKGLGRALVEDVIKNKRKNEEITVNASAYGVPFYESMGFLATGDERMEDGIIFTPMAFENLVKYYRREHGGIVRLTDKVIVHSLSGLGEWIPNQYAYSMFVDEIVDFEEISAKTVQNIIDERKGRKII